MKVQKPIALVIYMLGFCSLYGVASPVPKVQNFKTHQASFVENKGQLADETGNQIPDIKYYIHDGGVNVYCRPGKISFVFSKAAKDEKISEATGWPVSDVGVQNSEPLRRFNDMPSQTTINRADLTLLNSNPASQILASDQQEYYENYYTAYTPEEGITHVHTYKTITYKLIYPNIDMVLHAKEGGMKYEFVVYPGGKVSDIQIRWEGLEGIKRSKDSKIEYSFALGRMEESKPVSFQDNNEIRSDFKLNNKRIGFDIGEYDKNKTLVIDPTLEWGTYFGGSGYEESRGVSADAFGNIYFTGRTRSSTGIATTGVYKTSFVGNDYDAFLAKFNSTGSRIWATYYGGTSYEQSLAVCTDISGNIFITGETTSNNGISSAGAYQTSLGGNGPGSDAFLAKFDSSGNLNWATYFGGGDYEYGFGVATDVPGNVYITGFTGSSSGIATTGAFQSSNYGNDDAFLAKFTSSGSLSWATYYGGGGNDQGNAVTTDAIGNVYFTGITYSKDNIAFNSAYQTSFSGTGDSSDAFLVKFNGAGNRLWATYYGGNARDQGNGICTDASGNIYMTGQTQSKNGIASIGSFQTSFGGTDDAFLAKFNSSGMLSWATYYGGNGNEEGLSICKDGTGNVYITGATGSKQGIATAGAYQTVFGGGQNAFLAQFRSSGNLGWSTYYGGYGDNFASGISSDILGDIYIAGTTDGNLAVTSSGTFQTSFGGGYGDAFLVKFSPYPDAGIKLILSPKDSFCPSQQIIKVLLENFGSRDLNSVQIATSINGKLQKSFKWSGKLAPDSTTTLSLGNFSFLGSTDTIKAWTSLPNGVIDSFPQNDTATSIVYVSALPSATAGPDTTLCYNETYTMQGAGGITYLWTPAKYLNNDTIPAPKATVPNTQLYILYVRNKYGCEDSANVLLSVKPKLNVKINPVPAQVCSGNLVQFSAISSGGDSTRYVFSWPHDSLKGNPVSKKIYQSGWHTVVLTDNCSGLPGLDSVYIAVTPRPKADFTILNRKPYLPDTAFRFQNQSKNVFHYQWTFGDSSVSNTNIDPVHIYTDSGTYKITLIAYGTCTNDTGYGYIHIFSKYINIFIPDAFSPNGDGINDVFLITGLGFDDYDFTIYNRWGELIYATSDVKKSWNGRFKNELAPPGVYEYMITVTDQFGIKHYFSGNLTLMR